MNHILTSGRVSRRLIEMIFVAIFSLKDCHYCEAAHHAFCLNIGVSQTQIEKLIANHSIDEEDSAKDKAAIDFAVRLARNSHASSEDDFQVLKEYGFDEEEIMEIIAMSGMAVFYNHLVNATKINIDNGFKQILARHAENDFCATIHTTELPSDQIRYFVPDLVLTEYIHFLFLTPNISPLKGVIYSKRIAAFGHQESFTNFQ